MACLMTEAAATRNQGSKANGSLMRATPLGVWGATRSDEALIAATQEDARLSHPNASCVEAAVVHYVEALRETLAGGGDTDSNARIVGGLVGARWGAGAILEAMKAAVLGCDTGRGPHPRPEALHPRSVRARIRALSQQ